MKIGQACCMNRPVLITAAQLDESIEVSQLKIVVGIEVIGEPDKKAVLVKIIIDHFLAKIDVYLIVDNKGNITFIRRHGSQWNLEQEIVPQPEIKLVSIREGRIIEHISPESFFKPQILHAPEPGIFCMPLNLLPGPVFGSGYLFVIVGRVMMNIGITCSEFGGIACIIGDSGPDEQL